MTIGRAIRLLLGLICLCLVVWSFFDVGRRALQARSQRRARPITLTVVHWGDQAEDQIVQRLVEQYQREHPHVRIVRINPGGGEAFNSKLKTMLAAGTPPDVFYLRPESLPEFASLGLIPSLDGYFAKEDPAWREDFFPLLLDAYRYDVDTQRTGSGKLYGLPKDFSTAVFYVNLDLFERAGITVPYGGWTWDEFEAAMKKITALTTPDGPPIYGGMFDLSWPDPLRNIIWTFGGDFFGENFRDVTLDEPPAQQALEMIVRTRLQDKTVYNATGIAKDAGQEFFNGNIGCTGPVGRWKTPRFKDITAFRWDVVPVPYGTQKASQIFHNAWTMSAKTKHPDEAFKLIKFLCGREGQVMQARLGLAIPALQSVANSDDFLNPPGLPRIHTQLFLDAMQYARLQQNPRQAEWARIVGDRITKSIQLGQVTPMENAKEIESAWLAELNSPLRKQQWSPMRWDVIGSITAGVVVTLVFALWWKARREKLGPVDRATERAGWAFISPWLIGFLLLTLGPMVLSLLLSFTRWSAMSPMGEAESVGLANYKQLLTVDPTFMKSLQVTGYYVLLAVPIGQVAALAVALLMNLKLPGITVFRTIYFVPSVVSGVALAVLWLQIFNNDYGILNAALRPIAAVFGATPPDWFGRDAQVWAIPAFVIMSLWTVGSGMIIYLAGLKGIPTTLYEAAAIDGAGPLRRLWNVTLPQLSPLIFYNLVMAIIGSFQVFTQAYVMTGAGPDNATLFYVLNLYRQAFEFHNMGYASAMAWVLFVIILLLTLIVFRGSKNLVHYEGLK